MDLTFNEDAMSENKAVDIIWNMTLVCPWDCPVCCVDAVKVSRKDGYVELLSNGLNKLESFPVANTASKNIYDQALEFRQHSGLELTYDGKLRVLDNLHGFRPKLDFSGGDPLSATENLEVMRVASRRFGRKQITLTATGAGLSQCEPSEIAPLIGELNFTYDSPNQEGGATRPSGYAVGNLRKAAQFGRIGTKTRGECPLTIRNTSDDTLTQIFLNLHDNGIDKLLVMRLFPVGRSATLKGEFPSRDQYRQAIDTLRALESRYKTPALKIQCALRMLVGDSLVNNPCDLFRESFGLTPNGTLLASPWAINHIGEPLDESWVLGNLARVPLKEILENPRAKQYASRLDENFGHCKIFAFLNSSRKGKLDRIFDQSDPLYS